MIDKSEIKQWLERNGYYASDDNEMNIEMIEQCFNDLSGQWVSVNTSKKCEYDGCEKMSETIAYDREESKALHTCDDHSDVVVEKDYPEYWHTCPNCGLDQGIN